MQTPARQQYRPLVRIADITMGTSCAALMAILLTWAASSIGGVNEGRAPTRAWAISAQAAGPKAAPAGPTDGASDRPAKPTCAELGGIAAKQHAQTTHESRGTVGCGIPRNLAAGTPATRHRVE